MAKIALVLVDDWELRGDGSGDMRRIQFERMRELTSIYEAYGLRGSFNAEVMQQLHHLEFGARHPELAELAAEWEEVVLDTYRRGHDVQLHVHSQWSDADYRDGRWKLSGNWSILTYPLPVMRRMIGECRDYLEALLRRVDPAYKCVSFRSGAWAIAPNDHILSVLVEQGIVFDMSIVSGICFDNDVIQLDYRNCEEPFMPFYPDMTDARRVAAGPSPIIAVPTLSFHPSRRSVLKQDLNRLLNRVRGMVSRRADAAAVPPGTTNEYSVWQHRNSLRTKLMNRLSPQPAIADLSAVTYSMMHDMIGSVRTRARALGAGEIPIVLENHTKDVVNFDDIRRFADYVSRQDDLEVVTLRQLAERLQAGAYPIAHKVPAAA